MNAEDVLRYIRKSPGARCYQIAEALDAPASYVSVELRALRRRGAITSEGNTRGTRYTAVKGAK